MPAFNPSASFLQYRDADPTDAKFFWTGGPVEVTSGVWFQSLMSGVTGFETDAGLVLVDTGTKFFAPQLAEMLRSRTQSPVHTAIYTHGHVDHAYGLGAFLTEGQGQPRVIAHEAMVDRFARYEQTAAYNSAINLRQFGGIVPDQRLDVFETPLVPPNETYTDRLAIEAGGRRFELHHARGETDDHTWVFCPDNGVLCTGDLFIWGVPNGGNPQKVQRYPWEWAAALREMAALDPVSLCPGHGGPVVDDAALVRDMLESTADYLDAVVSQTIDALNDGAPPLVDIVHRVDVPRSDLPWLQPVYDDPEFIVQNVVRYFGGWYTGRPSELKPAPRAAAAAEVAALAGGAETLAARARELAESPDDEQLRIACHLADIALEADPESSYVRDAVAAVYDARSGAESSLMAANIFASAADYARKGRPYV